MPQVNDLSRSLAAFDPISALVVVVEMSKTSWLVSGVVPGVERQPLKKLEPDATALLRLIERWRIEAVRAGRPIRRIALAYEAVRHLVTISSRRFADSTSTSSTTPRTTTRRSSIKCRRSQ